jgi:membrane-bound lytic murein transglycosylase B
MRKLGIAASFLAASIVHGRHQRLAAASAAILPKGFNGFIKDFRQEAAAAGIGPRGLSALDGVEYQPGIIKKDRPERLLAKPSSTSRPAWSRAPHQDRPRARRKHKDLWDAHRGTTMACRAPC